MQKVRTCNCGNKRIAPSVGNFLCEVCLFKEKHPQRKFKPATLKPQKYDVKRLKYQNGRGVDLRTRPGNLKVNEVIINYEMYITSSRWYEKRMEAFQARGRVCEACGTKERLRVHHANYARLFNEIMEDLRVLCEDCHDTLHKKFKTQRQTGKRWLSLYHFTIRFIQRKIRSKPKQYKKTD